MTEAPIVYCFDEDGYFVCSRTAQPSPRIQGKFLIPRQSTTVAPDIPEGFFGKWDGAEWINEKIPASAQDFVGVIVSHKSQTARNQLLRQLLQKFVEEDSEHYRVIRGPEDEGLWWAVEAIPEPTEEEIAQQQLSQAKAERAAAVSKIVVEVDGMKFDGDEEAQTRMGRTIAAAVALGVDLKTYKQTWVLADNTVAQVTISQLAQALKLAGEQQTELWTVPYEG